ncbi:MAG: transglycosylase SLT domain-containing protein [Alphaproteobacteria bacterium]|nr:transglycosylase SLT domain-containing protein [Alphaproteobacteria bacterium]
MLPRLVLPSLLSTCLLLAAPHTASSAPPPPGADDLMVDVPETLRGLRLDLSDDVLDALRTRDWGRALAGLRAMDARALPGPLRADHAFVLAWTAIRADAAASAVPLLGLLGGDGGSAPPNHLALVRGELLRAAGRPLDALSALEAVAEASPLAPRALAQRAEILHDLGRTAEASALYETLVARPDPADGSAFALLALARRRGPGSPAADVLLARLWTWYPGTAEEREGTALWTAANGPPSPGWEAASIRAERLMDRGDLDGAIALAQTLSDHLGDTSVRGCQLAYTLGRSLYKRNRLTDAVAAFGDAGTRCAGVDGADGEKILYLQGTAEFRRSRMDASVAAFAAIADLYADTTFADDGLTRAGISALEGGDTERALTLWRAALDRFPTGDTVPEATFRLAFTLYDEGRTDEAVAVADRLAQLPLSADEVHVHAGQYWAARWRAYPSVHAPHALTKDAAARAEAVRLWAEVARSAPTHWYGALAWAQLDRLDPAVAARVATHPPPLAPDATWSVRAAFLADPDVADGVALLRLGLVDAAAVALADVDPDALLPGEVGWWMELRIDAGDWVATHDALHRWLRVHPLGTLGDAEPLVVRLAFPDRYWDLTRVREAEVGLQPRFLHALVREESSFDRKIVSYAGARGLSQLMPATAKEVARKVGVSVAGDALFDPDTNLRVGARYLSDMVTREQGDTSLALACYNAGPGNVDKWVRERGNLPLDEFVERIPFRDTRGYVKRVTSTWQTMRYAFHPELPAFVDVRPFLDKVLPDRD